MKSGTETLRELRGVEKAAREALVQGWADLADLVARRAITVKSFGECMREIRARELVSMRADHELEAFIGARLLATKIENTRMRRPGEIPKRLRHYLGFTEDGPVPIGRAHHEDSAGSRGYEGRDRSLTTEACGAFV